MKNLPELLISMLFLLLLAAVGLWFSRARNKPSQRSCPANLQRLYNGWIQMRQENAAPPSTNEIFRSLAAYCASPDYLKCPEDGRQVAPNLTSVQLSNVSYFLTVDGPVSASTIIAGDRNVVPLGGVIVPF